MLVLSHPASWTKSDLARFKLIFLGWLFQTFARHFGWWDLLISPRKVPNSWVKTIKEVWWSLHATACPESVSPSRGRKEWKWNSSLVANWNIWKVVLFLTVSGNTCVSTATQILRSPLYSETFRVGFGNLYSETFRLDSETFPVVFGNLCIRATGVVTKPLSSETFPGVFGNLYSETFPGGFGNFSGWIRKLARLDSETCPVGFGNLYSETFPGGFGNLYSETYPGGFGNFSGWIRKLARLDSETFPVGFRNLIQKFVFFARYEETWPHPTPALDLV